MYLQERPKRPKIIKQRFITDNLELRNNLADANLQIQNAAICDLRFGTLSRAPDMFQIGAQSSPTICTPPPPKKKKNMLEIAIAILGGWCLSCSSLRFRTAPPATWLRPLSDQKPVVGVVYGGCLLYTGGIPSTTLLLGKSKHDNHSEFHI